jgi:AcrR family transcriptional regulator
MMRRAPRQTGPQRRATILDAAAERFAAGGYHPTTIQEIATAAGITKPVLYDHFPSKVALYVTLIEQTRDELTSSTAAAMAPDAPVHDRVAAAIDGFFAYVERRPAAARVLFTPPEGDRDAIDAARRVQAEATGRLVALLAAEPDFLPGAADRDRRLELCMEFIKIGLHGLAAWWADHPDTPRETLVRASVDLAWGGLRSQLAGREVR